MVSTAAAQTRPRDAAGECALSLASPHPTGCRELGKQRKGRKKVPMPPSRNAAPVLLAVLSSLFNFIKPQPGAFCPCPFHHYPQWLGSVTAPWTAGAASPPPGPSWDVRLFLTVINTCPVKSSRHTHRRRGCGRLPCVGPRWVPWDSARAVGALLGPLACCVARCV